MLKKQWNKIVTQLKQMQLLQQVKKLKNLILYGTTQEVSKENETPHQHIRRGMVQKGSLAAIAVLLAVVMIFAMTAAWYSNVIHTTGLSFNVSEWGLDGSVNIDNELKNAAPGESGEIDLEVLNSSDGIIDVKLNVDRVGLYNDVADMRKRLYFYIDDTVQRNGETADRIYLNSEEKYSYTVLAKQKLILGKQGNDSSLKWEWVYDVLGYYFYGNVTTDTTAKIDEYLRPVVYDYDAATFTNGQLITVDGKTGVSAFISQITANDGYSGTTTTSVKSSDGKTYYPVTVDDNGNGVWIYCCTLGEIQYENVVDTSLGSAEQDSRRFQTNLNVIAQQKKLTVATVNTADELQTALSDDVHNMIVLSDNLTLTKKVNVPANSEKIVDMADKTISTDLTGNLITTEEGAALTIMNGSIKATDAHRGALISIVGSDVALCNVTITDVVDAIWVADQNSTKSDTRMNIVGCTINCSDSGLFIKGNGPVTERETFINIEDSQIISTGYYGIVGNGSALYNGNWGTNITVKNSTVKAKYAAIYHPQRDSSLLIDNSVLEGTTPVAIKGGSVVIKDSQISQINEAWVKDELEQPAFSNSGFSNTGAGVYVETSYDYPCTVELKGKNKVISYFADAVLVYDSSNIKYKLTISGGTYSSDVSSFVADGYVCKKNDNDLYEVKAK